MNECKTFWGSHGCNLPKDHEGVHRCFSVPEDPCSEYDDLTELVRFNAGGFDAGIEPVIWGDWTETYKAKP